MVLLMVLLMVERECDNQSISLASLPVGARARIKRVEGGRQLLRRLISLGLPLGAEISVLQQRGRGVVVANGGIRVALGSGIADKLMMAPLDAD